MSELALKVQGLSKSFEMGGATLPVLCGIDLEVGVGERVAIVGQSGSGKSTFLHVVLDVVFADFQSHETLHSGHWKPYWLQYKTI